MNHFLILIVCCASLAFAEQCAENCKHQIKTKMESDPFLKKLLPSYAMSVEGRRKMREMTKNYITGEGQMSMPFLEREKFDLLCNNYREAESCLEECPESELRTRIEKFMLLFNLTCNEECKSSLNCLKNIFTTKSQTCINKCKPVGQKVLDFIEEREADPETLVLPTTEVIESHCKFMNCRYVCRKDEIVEKCQEKGLETLKKFMTGVVTGKKALFVKAGGSPSAIPPACDPENLWAPNEY